jgi:hypothetical protein
MFLRTMKTRNITGNNDRYIGKKIFISGFIRPAVATVECILTCKVQNL